MSHPDPEEAAQLLDLTGVPLDRIARICESAPHESAPDDLADYPVLRQALARLREESAGTGDAFLAGGHSNNMIR